MEPTSPYFPFLIAAGATVIGAIFVAVGLSLRKDGRDLRSGLVTARAIIVKKFRDAARGTWGGLEDYFIRAAFTDDSGTARECELKVQSKAWRIFREGGTVSLNHPAGHPEQVCFGSAFAMKVRTVVGTVMIIVGIGAAIFFVVSCVIEFLRGPSL